MNATSKAKRVILVNPPFQPLRSPATGIAYIYAVTAGAGHRARVADSNYPFARWLLPVAPLLAPQWDGSSAAHLGQLLFSKLTFAAHDTPTFKAAIRTAEITHGVEFSALLDGARAEIERWLSEQDFAEADVVAFTLLNYQLLAGLYLIDRVRALAPKAKIVVGGFYVSKDNGVALMQKSAAIDFCVHGEGEKTFLELLDVIDDEAAWPNVLGLVYRDNTAARTPIANPKRPLMTGPELDALPFPNYDWISPADFETYKLAIPVVSIRGCYWGKCTFCSDFRFNKTTYARSPAGIVAEMEAQAEKHKTSRFYFADLATNDTIARINGIADGLAASRYKFEFLMLFVPDNIDVPMLRKLKAAGCTGIQYGIESLSGSLLKKMGKSPRVFENLKAIKLTELANMQAISNIIKYFPNETLDEVIENYEVVSRYPELANGYVFARPVEFRSRDGATITKLLVRQRFEPIERAVHYHYWPDDWSRALPDIEVMVEIKSPNRALHAHLWVKIEELLEAGKARRAMTRFVDSGDVLRLSKYNHATRAVASYELTNLARSMYLALEDEMRLDALAFKLGRDVHDAEMVETLAMLVDESLVLRDGDRVIATINPNVAELELDPLITTVENASGSRENQKEALS